MSKGTQVYTLRLPDELSDSLVEAVARRNANSAEKPWTTSDFIRIAIMEKLLKSARRPGRKVAGSVTDAADWTRSENGKLVVPPNDVTASFADE